MVPYRSEHGKRNLQRGIGKMEKTMSPAARVRREFLLGRPPKVEPWLHPSVVLSRAEEKVADIRRRMEAVGLKPEHIDATVVYVRADDIDTPRFVTWSEGIEQIRAMLMRPDVMAIGMVMRQFDESEGRVRATDFAVQFQGLSPRAAEVLKKAVQEQAAMLKLTSTVN